MIESTLHNQLKNFYAQPTDLQEVWVDGYLVDVLKEDLIIEIQTQNFYALRPKLTALLTTHKICLVYPIVSDKWIVRNDNEHISRRLSPRHGRIEDIFYELIRFPQLMKHPNLTLELIIVNVEEIRRNDGKGSWRRKGWSIIDRNLLKIKGQVQFFTPSDFRSLLPDRINTPFTVRELANQTGISINLAQKMTYCLQRMDQIQITGKIGRATLYSPVRAD